MASEISREVRTSALQYILLRLPAHMLMGAAVLGAIAITGGVNLPSGLAIAAAGIGFNILANLIERIAGGEKVPDREIRDQTEQAIENSNIAQLVTEREFYHTIRKVLQHIDLGNQTLKQEFEISIEALFEKRSEEVLRHLRKIEELVSNHGRTIELTNPEAKVNKNLKFASSDVPTLADLVNKSGRAKTHIGREALCVEIGLNLDEIMVGENIVPRDFSLLLVQHLYILGKVDHLIKLCDATLAILKHGSYEQGINLMRKKLSNIHSG